MEKRLTGTDNSVEIARGREEGIRGTDDNGKNAVKINLKNYTNFLSDQQKIYLRVCCGVW